jgi:uncharacterized membrane protein YbhN (UPF0104 family)
VNRILKFLASLLITVVLGWWAFRDTNWNEQWESLKSANYWWLLPYFAVLLTIHLCRTMRWGFLLSRMERVKFRQLNEAAGIGFMMLLLLPFRLGEFARPFLLNQRSSIRRSAAMTSVVLERIVDGISIAVLLRILLFFVPAGSEQVRLARWGANVMFGIFAGGLSFLLFALWHQGRAVGLVRWATGLVSQSLADKAAHVVDSFVGALRQIPRGWDMAGFVSLTGAYWALNGFGMFVLTQAFSCDAAVGTSCMPLGLSLFQSYVVLCVLVVGLMIPAAPGMIGTFQAAVKLGLSLFLPASLVHSKGVAYSNVMWLCQTTQQIGLGLILMSLANISFRDVAGKLSKEGEPRATSPVM